MISLFAFHFVQMDTVECNVHAQKIVPLYGQMGNNHLERRKRNTQIAKILITSILEERKNYLFPLKNSS